MKLLPDFKEFINALLLERVEFLVVGAYALAAFGHPRNTGDIDIWIGRGPQNVAGVERALVSFGFGSLEIRAADLALPKMCFQLGYAPARIDILTDISGLDFADCYARRINVELDDLSLPFICRDDFIKNKRAAGRLKDLADVDVILRDSERT